MARNPYRRDPRWRRVHINDLPSWLGAWWKYDAPDCAKRVRWGARAACRRLRAERDALTDRVWELEEALRQSETRAAEEYSRGYHEAERRMR